MTSPISTQVVSNTFGKWQPTRNLSIEKAFEKMLKNTAKAYKDHMKLAQERCSIPWGRLSLKDFPYLEASSSSDLLVTFSLEVQIFGSTGTNKIVSEDFYFALKTAYGFLGGVFDGHGGQDLAKTGCAFFSKKFFLLSFKK